MLRDSYSLKLYLVCDEMGDPLSSLAERDLYTDILESDLYQHVNRPTQDKTILDLILSITENLMSEVNVRFVFSSGGRPRITFSIRMKESKDKS